MKMRIFITALFIIIFLPGTGRVLGEEDKSAFPRGKNRIDPEKRSGEKTPAIREPVFDSVLSIHESGNRKGRSVILVHGLGDTALATWKNIIPALSPHYHVIALDLPGFKNPGRKNISYSPSNYARFIKWITDTYTDGKPVIAGHSLGGAVSLYYAGTYPESLSKLILISTAGILHRAVYLRNVTKVKPDENKNLLEKPKNRLNYFLGRTIEKLDSSRMLKSLNNLFQKRLFQKNVLNNNLQITAALELINTDFSEKIDRTTVPVSIIWGDKDDVAPMRTGILLHSNLPNSHLHILKGAGHSPMDDNPADVNRIILRYLSAGTDKRIPGKRSEKEKKEILLKNLTHKTISGRYKRIVIENCSFITLNDVRSGTLVIKNSDVIINAGRIESGDTGITAKNSKITMTGTIIKSKTGIITENSYLDLAGVRILSGKTGIISHYKSSIVFSVCRIITPHNKKYLHDIKNLYNGDKL